MLFENRTPSSIRIPNTFGIRAPTVDWKRCVQQSKISHTDLIKMIKRTFNYSITHILNLLTTTQYHFETMLLIAFLIVVTSNSNFHKFFIWNVKFRQMILLKLLFVLKCGLNFDKVIVSGSGVLPWQNKEMCGQRCAVSRIKVCHVATGLKTKKTVN